ncbi:hypothetical protein J5N97_013466 [Dioscorea zingiberensis]|uniref:Uncharacterized protein n=1 Tax=Dioscorea zingiberensis TaxID=325984 RepID=A0A9D5CS74_9LILI|nr:hypothetical protein J5N97_013466 [Dioscorea zingiberensis]
MAPLSAEFTSCGSLLKELQGLWDDIGENDHEKDTMILQLEQECLDVYRRKVEQAKKHKSDLQLSVAEGESEVSNLLSVLGEQECLKLLGKPNGSLKEQLAALNPLLEDLRRKKEERIKEFLDVESKIAKLCVEIAGNAREGTPVWPQVDERDLTLNRLGELKSQLQELLKDKSLRLQKVNAHMKVIHELSTIMSIDFSKLMFEVHQSFGDLSNSHPKSISNDTLAKLAGLIQSLKQEKKQRLEKLQGLGSALIELWNLLDTPTDEQKRFNHITFLISESVDTISAQACLASDVIEQAKLEVERLNMLKGSKMKELLLKKQNELEQIYSSVHMEADGDSELQVLVNLIDSGKADLSELLSNMDNKITNAKEQALSRRDILDKVDKWEHASTEESWLDDYERDQNRYNAGRGAHKNLKRAEKARVLVNKIPSLLENLTSKVKAWEKEKGMTFLYNKMPLLETLEGYTARRQQREEEKRRLREQKKIQEQFATEQEAMFGSKPSPMRPFTVRKPLGQSMNGNTVGGTPTNYRVSTPLARQGISSSGKETKGRGKACTVIPVNYVALPKEESVSQNSTSSIVSP